jgi:hypothetical protein
LTNRAITFAALYGADEKTLLNMARNAIPANVSPRQRLQILRDFIAAIPEQNFNMSEWREEHECGTVACIGGWTTLLFDVPQQSSAGECLGLTGSESDALFCPNGWSYGVYSRQDALDAIDGYLAKGEIVWPKRDIPGYFDD